MFHIIKAEIDYSKKLILICFALILLVCLYEVAISGVRIGYVLILIYMLTTLWNVFRNKERRDYQLAGLPLSIRQIARARFLMIFLACFSISLFYYLTYLAFNIRTPDEPVKLIAYTGIILAGFSIYFGFRDFRVFSLRKIGLSRNRFKAILILIVLGLNFLIIYGIIQLKTSGEVPPLIRYLDKINLLADPPANSSEIVIFFILSLILAYSTVFTFGRRKSYLE
jgi:hypothetical protein